MGRRIGPYLLLELIGAGGMGEVWRAEQTSPVKRTVALKLIKAGMDSREVVARFEAERQALALMDHPCIAKVFDAGITAGGRPYFAMEYVPGIPIHAYCDRRRLDTPQRLQLFQQVCQGVQHAHQKAVLHRDLKPTNVLVTDVDGKPLPKIIDFGVAKATTQKLTERTMYTALGQLIGTPEYMSPEQAELTGESVDTRTDVYSLGVILYELLVGALPFESQRLRHSGLEGIVRILREEDPPRPSTRLTTLGDRATEIAERRRTGPRRLGHELREDLDWIVMRSLEKDRNRRYASPHELAQDIDRHLRHQPVLAGPPSAAYRARKFVRRHRVGVSVLSGLLVVLVLFSLGMAIQSQRIARERDRAEREAAAATRVTELLIGMLKSADPEQSRGEAITVREVLDAGAVDIHRELSEEPRLQAKLMGIMGEVYHSIGLPDSAEALYASALELLDRTEDVPSAERAVLLHDLGVLYADLGEHERADSLLQSALRLREQEFGPQDLRVAATLNRLGELSRYRGLHARADSLYSRALAIYTGRLGEECEEVADVLNNQSVLYWYMGETDRAEAAMIRSLEIRREVLPENHPSLGANLNNLGALNYARGDYEAAEDYYQQALEVRENAYGPVHSEVAQTLTNLALLYGAQSRSDEERALFERVIEIYRQIYGEQHHLIAGVLRRMGHSYLRDGERDEAVELFQQALAMQEATLGPDHIEVAASLVSLAQVDIERGDFDAAAPRIERALAIYGDDYPNNRWYRSATEISQRIAEER